MEKRAIKTIVKDTFRKNTKTIAIFKKREDNFLEKFHSYHVV